jgi:hypothetical protein
MQAHIINQEGEVVEVLLLQVDLDWSLFIIQYKDFYRKTTSKTVH